MKKDELLLNISEDERLARLTGGDPDWKEGERASCEGCLHVRTAKHGSLVCTPDDQDAPHIARQDPARTLREAAPKRNLIALHEGTHRCTDTDGVLRGYGPYACPSVLLLQEAYGHHRDPA